MTTIIGLDFDETYTRKPWLFDTLIEVAPADDAEVVIVTYRDEVLDRHPALDRLEAQGVRVICTGGVAKRWHCLQRHGLAIDIWIDDRHETITENSRMTPEDLATWRAEQARKIKELDHA